MFIEYLVRSPKDLGATEMKSSGPLRVHHLVREIAKEIKEYDRIQ